MTSLKSPSGYSWFRSRGGRRFGCEFALIIALKIVLLIVIWYALFAPQARPDTSPAAIARHLFTSMGAAEVAHD